MESILLSKGLKRLIAGALAAISAIVVSHPELSFITPYLSYLATFFGITGLISAAASGTITKYKTASLASILQLLTEAAAVVPALLPFVSLLRMITAFFGLGALAVAKPVVTTTNAKK